MVDALNSKKKSVSFLWVAYGWGGPTTNVGMVVEIEPGG
jgi:hypothetical protein